MVDMADNIRAIIEDVTTKMMAMPQPDRIETSGQLYQSESEQPAAGREEAVKFTPDDTAFMIDCDLHPTYNGITIQTENDEGASLSVDDITRLSDVLRRYAILFKQQQNNP